MKKSPLSGTLLVYVLLVIGSFSCTKEVDNATAKKDGCETKPSTTEALGMAVGKTAQEELLKAVRGSTAKYHATTQAIKAGYEPSNFCVSVPGLGGMGYHWTNPLLVDDKFDPLQPEAVLYASGPGGKLKLIAVEYVVLDKGQPRPMFAGHPLDIKGTPNPEPHWSLHVWLYEENPKGIFEPFNPNITCP